MSPQECDHRTTTAPAPGLVECVRCGHSWSEADGDRGRPDEGDQDVSDQVLDEARFLAYEATKVQHASGVLCPLCPACGGVAASYLAAVSWPGQAMCETDGCPVLMWNPTRSPKWNLDGGTVVDLDGKG